MPRPGRAISARLLGSRAPARRPGRRSFAPALPASAAAFTRSSRRSTSISACADSFWLCTETYSPVAMEKAPPTSPANPARATEVLSALAPATPGDQREVGHQAVHHPEHRWPQPSAGHRAMLVMDLRAPPSSVCLAGAPQTIVRHRDLPVRARYHRRPARPCPRRQARPRPRRLPPHWGRILCRAGGCTAIRLAEPGGE